MNLQTVRIIPFDIGFSVNNKEIEKFKKIINNLPHITFKQNIFKNGFDYILDIQILKDLRMLIYADGSGEFIFFEENIEFNLFDDLDIKNVLHLRNKAHKSFLTHNHERSSIINTYLDSLRSVKNKKYRRITSQTTWENQGLSYVMTLFLFDFDYAKLSENQKVKIYNLLYTDNFNKFSKTASNIQDEILSELNNSVDILKSVHIMSSWASYIVFSENIANIIDEIIKFEIDVQHVWMYAYITEKALDDMFLKLDAKNTYTTHINNLYQELSTMKLCVYKYSGVMSSTMHEREHRIYLNLIQTSKLDILIQTIFEKYEMLDNRMNWIINERRFSNSKKVETFIFIFTLLQLFTFIQEFKLSYLGEYWYFFIAIILLTVFLFFRKK